MDIAITRKLRRDSIYSAELRLFTSPNVFSLKYIYVLVPYQYKVQLFFTIKIMSTSVNFSHFTFDNRFVNQLPADTETNVFSRQVEQAAYSFVNPTKVKAPQLVAVSSDVAV